MTHAQTPADTVLEVEGLSIGYGPDAVGLSDAAATSSDAVRRAVLSAVSLTLTPGRIVALVGANGCGKSTLLKALIHRATVFAGRIRWFGRRHGDWRANDLARRVAYLPQSPTWDAAQTVRETLRLGRVPYGGWFGFESPADGRAVDAAARRMGLTDWLDRPLGQLSGGERQRVLLGRCLAQSAEVLLLDEPDTHLDLAQSAALAGLLRSLRDDGLSVLTASHDLNLAAAIADEVLVFAGGVTLARGPASQTLTPEVLPGAFGVSVGRAIRPDGRPVVYVV